MLTNPISAQQHIGNAVSASTPDKPAPALSLLDKEKVEIFSDAAIKNGMQSLKIPGITLAIVYQGQPLLIKGYGLADVENNYSVDSNTTEFAVASISKTLTFTALLGLIDQGKLSWDDKVEDILQLELFNGEKKPILIRHLFTHSAGFEDSYLGQSAANDEQTNISLMQYIKQFVPQKMSNPDEFVVYSNYGSSLAGAVIEKITGQPFSHYMQTNLLSPLDMNYSSFYDAPIAVEGSRKRAVGYLNNRFGMAGERNHFHHFGLMPSAGLKSTAADMAKYLQFHLDKSNPLAVINTIGNNVFHQSVDSKSLPIKTNHSAIGGSAFGFWVNDFSGLTSIGHSGNTKGFKSELVIFPEISLGIFISANANNGHRLISPFSRNFVKQFFQQYLVSPKTLTVSQEELSRYSGLYLTKRRNDSSIERMAASSYYVGVAKDRLKVYIGNNNVELLPLGNGLFVEKETGKRIAFVQDEKQNSLILRDYDVLEKIKGWQDTGNLLKLVNLLAVLCAIILGLR
ncbi:MAG: beta-lactamase family protein, partial [Kangiellaceae bacterium]|nr:beta-lactamase family protein [Kangiellaceae bacterium]